MKMVHLLLLVLIASSSAKNLVFIGDSRTVGIAVYLFKYDYYEVTKYYGNGSNVVGTTARTYQGHSVKAIAETGASYSQFTNANKAVYKGIHTALSASASGTIVLLWLGVNGLNDNGTFQFYKNLASKYKKLTFYAISITGVVESKSGMSNSSIKRFNSAGLSNLKYKSILLNDDPTRVAINGATVLTINTSTTDTYGLHYYTNGYSAIVNAMLSGL